MLRRCKTHWRTRKLACLSICRTCQMQGRSMGQVSQAAPSNQCSLRIQNIWTTLSSPSKSQWTLKRSLINMSQNKSKKNTRTYLNKIWIVIRSLLSCGDAMTCSSGKACCQSLSAAKMLKSWLSRKTIPKDSAHQSSSLSTWEAWGRQSVYLQRWIIQKAQLQFTRQLWTRRTWKIKIGGIIA